MKIFSKFLLVVVTIIFTTSNKVHANGGLTTSEIADYIDISNNIYFDYTEEYGRPTKEIYNKVKELNLGENVWFDDHGGYIFLWFNNEIATFSNYNDVTKSFQISVSNKNHIYRKYDYTSGDLVLVEEKPSTSNTLVNIYGDPNSTSNPGRVLVQSRFKYNDKIIKYPVIPNEGAITINANVVPYVKLDLASDALDLGDISPIRKGTGEIDLTVESNSNYKVSVQASDFKSKDNTILPLLNNFKVNDSNITRDTLTDIISNQSMGINNHKLNIEMKSTVDVPVKSYSSQVDIIVTQL